VAVSNIIISQLCADWMFRVGTVGPLPKPTQTTPESPDRGDSPGWNGPIW